MQYTELIIKIKTSDIDKATSIISLLDIGGIYTEDYSDMLSCSLVQNFALIDEELLKKDTDNALLHIYFSEHSNMSKNLEFITARFEDENIEMTVLENKIKEDDYAHSWKQYYKPIKIGKVVIVPVWEEYEKSENEKILKIDPGMAFGTGSHETTSLCIETLQEYLKEGDTLLDLGCGSGILSVTGLILGVKKVDAIDIDPNAVKVTLENASLNEYSGEITSVSGNILQSDEKIAQLIKNKKYNVVIANIVADVIIKLSDFIKEYIKEEGYFITSGIITERAEETEEALKSSGLKVLEKREKKGWVCFVCRK